MHNVAVKYLRAFWDRNPGSEQSLKSWVDEAKKANCSQPAQIKEQCRSASILTNKRVVYPVRAGEKATIRP